MATDTRLKESLPAITERIVETYEECGAIHHLGHCPLPSYREVVEVMADLREILYPGYGRRQNLHLGNVAYHVGDLIDSLHDRLTQQIARAFRHSCLVQDLETDFEVRAQEIAIQFLSTIPEARRPLSEDAQAAYDGDPAAKSLDEIVFCYPGVAAISVYRLAHVLYELGVPLIPRMMTEYAHGKTGIDIHPAPHRQPLLHRPRHRRGDRRDRPRSATACEDLPGRDTRSAPVFLVMNPTGEVLRGTSGPRPSRTKSSSTPMRRSWAARRLSATTR